MPTVKINGMKCQHCVASTKKALESVAGVSNVVVDLDKGEATFDGSVAMNDIKQAVAAKGFAVID